MFQAANIIADMARALASGWSVRIPPEMRVTAGVAHALIVSQVGPSYPNEVRGVRHPVFGPTIKRPRPPWVTNQYRPFLVPATDAKADAAAEAIGLSVDDLCFELGFREE